MIALLRALFLFVIWSLHTRTRTEGPHMDPNDVLDHRHRDQRDDDIGNLDVPPPPRRRIDVHIDLDTDELVVSIGNKAVNVTADEATRLCGLLGKGADLIGRYDQ